MEEYQSPSSKCPKRVYSSHLVSPIVPAPTKCTALEVVAKPKVNVEELGWTREKRSGHDLLPHSLFHHKGGITLRAGETFFALNPVIFKVGS